MDNTLLHSLVKRWISELKKCHTSTRDTVLRIKIVRKATVKISKDIKGKILHILRYEEVLRKMGNALPNV